MAQRLSDQAAAMTEPSSLLSAFRAAAHDCALEMMRNADFIRAELPTLGLDASLARPIHDVCDALLATKHDVVSEVRELADASDPADRARRVERIVRWLGEEAPKLHAVVTALQASADADPRAGSAFLLVAESAVNVMRSRAAVDKAAQRIDTAAS